MGGLKPRVSKNNHMPYYKPKYDSLRVVRPAEGEEIAVCLRHRMVTTAVEQQDSLCFTTYKGKEETGVPERSAF